jgi:hypothetical protein
VVTGGLSAGNNGNASYIGGALTVNGAISGTTLTSSVNTNAGGANLSVTNSSAGANAQATIRFINNLSELGNLSLNSSTYSYGMIAANAIGIRSFSAAGVYLTSENASGSVKIGIGAYPALVADFSSTGLAVTGILSSTGAATFAGAVTVGGGTTHTTGTSGVFKATGTSSTGAAESQYFNDATNAVFGIGGSANANTAVRNKFFWYGLGGTVLNTLDGSGNQILTGSLTVSGAGTSTFAGAVTIGNTVNTVSPTSPNRTITMVVNGVTLYIAAKLTND